MKNFTSKTLKLQNFKLQDCVAACARHLGHNHLDLVASIAKVERSGKNLTGRLVKNLSILKLIFV
jgi:hypothetical protein